MIKHFLIICCIAFAAHAQRPLKWIADAAQTVPVTFDCSRGETLTFTPTLKAYGTTLTNYTASFQWQTNGMGTAFWSTNALVFTPSMDCGANRYRFFIRAESTNGVMYSANGTINMLHGPGAIVNALPFPVQSIDFATVSWTNEPWLESAAWDAWLSTNTYLKVELDPGIPSAISTAVAQAGTNAQAMADAAQTNAIMFASTNIVQHSHVPTEWVSVVSGTATLFRVYTSGYILQGYGSPDYMGLGPSAPPDTYIFQTPSRIEDGGITEVYDIPMASGYIYPFSLAISTAGIYSQIVIGSPQLSPSLWRTFETNYPVIISPFPDEPGVSGGWVLSKIADDAPITNSYPLAMISDIPAPIPQTNQLYVAQAGTVTGSQSNTIASALQPGATNELVTAAYVDVQKELHRDSATNVIWRTVWSNGWIWVIAYTNYPTN